MRVGENLETLRRGKKLPATRMRQAPLFPSMRLSTHLAGPSRTRRFSPTRALESPLRFRKDSCAAAWFKLENAEFWPQTSFPYGMLQLRNGEDLCVAARTCNLRWHIGVNYNERNVSSAKSYPARHAAQTTKNPGAFAPGLKLTDWRAIRTSERRAGGR